MQKAKRSKTTLSQSDLNNIVKKMKPVFLTREEFHAELKKLPTREEMHKAIKLEVDTAKEELRAEIRLLPTKEEFFSRMDKLSGEVLAMRQEFTLHSGQHEKINDRLDLHDKHLGISTLE